MCICHFLTVPKSVIYCVGKIKNFPKCILHFSTSDRTENRSAEVIKNVIPLYICCRIIPITEHPLVPGKDLYHQKCNKQHWG